MEQIDLAEVLRRVIKYLIIGLVVGLAMVVVPKSKLRVEEILMIAVSVGVVYALLDVYAPGIGQSARLGTGFTLGSHLVGGL